MMKDYKNILIVRTDRMGDVILTTPAVKALRERYPKAKLSILVNPLTFDLVFGNPYLDEVLVDDRQKEHHGLNGYIRLVTLLQARHFDCAVIFHTKKRTNALCWLAGIPERVGYKNNKFGFLLTHPVPDTRHEGKKHEAQYCLDVLKHFGIESEALDLHVPVNEEAERWAKTFFQQNGITEKHRVLAIHAGASDPSKRWPVHRFAELIERLVERYDCRVIVVGASEDRALSRNLLKRTREQVLDLTGMTTISQLASLFKQCDLVVSNDSGPVHIAAGVGTPIISIFTRNQQGINPERWKPLGAHAQFVSVPYDETLSFKKAQPIDPKFLELIPTQEVLEAVDSIFKLC